MTQTILAVKNGTVKLPKTWRGAKVFVRESGDTLIIKKVQRAEFWNTWTQLVPMGKKVKRGDVAAAVRWARKRA